MLDATAAFGLWVRKESQFHPLKALNRKQCQPQSQTPEFVNNHLVYICIRLISFCCPETSKDVSEWLLMGLIELLALLSSLSRAHV